tara:strand:+ start:26200 stop:26550 length:351 start_codon:yes stop_codon:yes gene_type:complete
MNKYNLDSLDKWIFHVGISMVIPSEHIYLYKNTSNNLTLEYDTYFKIQRAGNLSARATEYSITNLNDDSYLFIKECAIHYILHNSDLNKEHPNPFFIECKKIYERNETIENILENN